MATAAPGITLFPYAFWPPRRCSGSPVRRSRSPGRRRDSVRFEPAVGQHGHTLAVAGIYDLVFDCGHPASLARFWASILDGYEVAPYDEAELERLRRKGIYSTEDDPGVMVDGPPGAPRLYFQLVPEPKQVKSRVHIDLRGDDHEAETARLVTAGARELETFDSHMIMSDPEGNEFCLTW